ncbi:hypothetical protein KVT40_004171 [Elsinoe batatas]|uniref:Uncharacterized protein n=1 Tax=Elsinoe batatas TaxID=2601811 RepID=A0A8K0L9R7_9PEZI|nr:hypothetical protein KVT40_004171 [Elsinoe batatas]
MPPMCVARQSCKLPMLQSVLESRNSTLAISAFDRHSLGHLWVTMRKIATLSRHTQPIMNIQVLSCGVQLDVDTIASCLWFFRSFSASLSGQVTFGSCSGCQDHHPLRCQEEILLQVIADAAMEGYKRFGPASQRDVDDNRPPTFLTQLVFSFRFPRCCPRYRDFTKRTSQELENEFWYAWTYATPFPLDKLSHHTVLACHCKTGREFLNEEREVWRLLESGDRTEVVGKQIGIQYFYQVEVVKEIW